MDIQYRLAVQSDLEDICAMVERVKQKFRDLKNDQWDEFYPTAEILGRDIQRGEMTVGFHESRLVVLYSLNAVSDPEYADGNWSDPEASFRVVHRLCVEPALQGTGIGKQTMRYIEKQAAELGAAYLRLDCSCRNESASRLYAGQGYTSVGRISRLDKGEFLLLEKKL